MNPAEIVELGLTENQSKVYIELLKHPEQTGGEIAKKLRIDRSFTYGILRNLADKGLVGSIETENRTLFYAADPKQFLLEIDEKKKKATAIIEKLNSIKPKKYDRVQVQTYSGKAGLKRYVRESLASPYARVLGGGDNIQKIHDDLKYDMPHYLEKIKDSNMDIKTLAAQEKGQTPGEVRVLHKPISPVTFTILENKLIIWSIEEDHFFIVIEGGKISMALQHYFDKLWGIADPHS
ncbi:MAG: helix-turn-helix domain-containing protein [Candidatus Woesearchaeota archaeon]|nr:helix-turn-helix domain-containing protein [Candidatus Woesearchaeota archaeon]